MIRKTILSILLVVTLVACNMRFAAPDDAIPVELPTTDPQLAIGQAVTQTLQAKTQIAFFDQQTLAARVTSTPSLTPSPTLTLTPTFTNTPEIPRVVVSVETNCRSGPGTAYDVLGVLPVGQPAEIIGRNASGDTWIIRLPSNPSIICWLWGYYGTVTGNTSGLMVYTPPPTPTPTGAFTFSYHFLGVGPGYQCMLFDVKNTGGMTWESYYISIRDITHGDTGSRPSNAFIDYDGWCIVTSTQLDLMPGETGIASGIMHMMHSFLGEPFEATLKLCSQDDLTGNCITQSITFNP